MFKGIYATCESKKGPTLGGMGSSDSESLIKQFPGSPIIGTVLGSSAPPVDWAPTVIKNELNSNRAAGFFVGTVMRGLSYANEYWVWGASDFDLDYHGHGNLTPPPYNFQWDGQGDPINSFVPNLTSAPDADWHNQFPPGTQMIEHANDPARLGSGPFVGVPGANGTATSPQEASNNTVWDFWDELPGVVKYFGQQAMAEKFETGKS